jgi:2-polyprenyl-3-methyl-5-hydroxy-6-metoxy-1,4-benzoquinol methylase
MKSIADISLSKICLGGENDLSGYKYALMTGDYIRPSTRVSDGPHHMLLKKYHLLGNAVLTREHFEASEYYLNAKKCIDLFGEYFPGIDTPGKIIDAAQRFIALYEGKDVSNFNGDGHSADNQPIEVRRIRGSSCYQLVQGNHRCAFALAKQETEIRAVIHEDKSEITLIQFLLDHLSWEQGEKHLYQPIPAPELEDEWTLVRGCQDRFDLMLDFLKLIGFTNVASQLKVMDIGSYFGWFMNQFERLGFNVFGLEKDNIPTLVAQICYPRLKGRILAAEAGDYLEQHAEKYDITLCLSIMHHMFYGRTKVDPMAFLKTIDSCTKHILFFEMGDENEAWFRTILKGWNPNTIANWVISNSSFSKVVCLGKDQDRKGSFANNFNRTLFAFLK